MKLKNWRKNSWRYLKYETNKDVYDFQKFQTIRYLDLKNLIVKLDQNQKQISRKKAILLKV